MLPDVDVQVLRPVVGEEWRWTDSPPSEGWGFSFMGFSSSNLLLVEDGDEEWRVSRTLIDLDGGFYLRRGLLTLSLDVPMRGEWEGQVNLADPRMSLLLHRGPITFRGGLISPIGGMDWPYTWNDWRVDGGASLSLQNLSGSVGGSYGESGALLRGSLGGRWKDASLEFSYMRGDFLQNGEATFSYRISSERVSTLPFLSVGFLTTPGTPSIRAGFALYERKPVRRPPVVDIPPPVPVEPPPPAVPPPPQKIARIRIEQHPQCLPRKDEERIIREMTERAKLYMGRFSYPDLVIETELLPCWEERAVIVQVLQLR